MAEKVEQDDGLTIKKLDYLQGKYVFRYPYTFSSIKWGLTLGSFFGLHTFVKTRNLRHSFMNWIEKTVVLTFAVWAYFYAKYNFYQNSINSHEEQQDERVREAQYLKKYIEFKLKLPPNANYSQEELIKEYEKYSQRQMERSLKLEIMLLGVDGKTFDRPSQLL